MYCYLECIVYDKLLKPRPSFWITLYIISYETKKKILEYQLNMDLEVKAITASAVLYQLFDVHYAVKQNAWCGGQYVHLRGHAAAQLGETLRYKPEGRGSIPYGVIGIFQLHNPSGRTMALVSTQPLTEMSTRCISWG